MISFPPIRRLPITTKRHQGQPEKDEIKLRFPATQESLKAMNLSLLRSILLSAIIGITLQLRVSAAEPLLAPWGGSAPEGMTILPHGMGLHLIKPMVRNRAYGVKVFPAQTRPGKVIAVAVYYADLIRPNKAADFKDIFGTPWYILPKQGTPGSTTCYHTVDGTLRNLLTPPSSPPGIQVDLGQMAMTAIRLHSIRPNHDQETIRMTYHFEVQSFQPLSSPAGLTRVTQFHKSFAMHLTLQAEFIDKLGNNGALQSGQFVLSPIKIEHEYDGIYENIRTSPLSENPYVLISGRDSTFDFADWTLTPSNGNLTNLINNWNRAWNNAADYVTGPTSSALLGHREDINLPAGGIPFAPFFANGADLLNGVHELPRKLSGIINRETPSPFDETLYFHAAPSIGHPNAGGRIEVTVEDGAGIEGSPGIFFRVTSSHALPTNLEFDVVAKSDTANIEEDLEYVPEVVTLFAGQTETRLHLPTNEDNIPEGTEKFNVSLVPRQDGIWMRNEEAVGTILDNDPVNPKRPPVIIRQPVSTNGKLGSTVVLDVAALGYGLKYQWSRNGQIIPGIITPRLEVPLIDENSGGIFQARVSNTLGSVLSASVQVSVASDFTVSPSALSAPASGGTYVVETNGEGSWQISTWELPYWLEVNPEGGPAGQSIQFTVKPNYGEEPRTEVVNVGQTEVMIRQAGNVGWQWKNPLPQGNDITRVVRRPGQWLAVGAFGTILSSSDGVTWSRRPTGVSSPLFDACWTGSLWVVVGESVILTSPDGENWTQRYNPSGLEPRNAVWTGSKVIAHSPLTLQYLESFDGLTWEEKTLQTGSEFWLRRAVRSPTGIWVAVGFQGIASSSSDSFNWRVVMNSSADLLDVTWTGSQFVAVGATGRIYTSTDGSSWTSRSAGTSVNLHGVHASGGLIVACGYNGTVLTSTDGASWTARFSASTRTIRSVQSDGSRWVGMGNQGFLVSSTNGTSWSATPSSPLPDLLGAAWSGSMAVAVGDSGRVLSSPNADTWTIRSSGTANTLRAVTWAGSRFCAVGAGGVVITSSDGITWTTRSSGTTDSLYAVTWTGSQIVAVGDNGRIITSPDGVTWTTRNSNTSNTLFTAIWTGSVVVAGGEGGTIRTSNSSASTWTTRSSGTAHQISAMTWSGSHVVAKLGSGECLYSSTGSTWNLGGYISSSANVLVANGGTIWAFGGSFGFAGATSSPANDWEYVRLPVGSSINGAVSLGGRLLVVGNNGTILAQDGSVQQYFTLSPREFWVPSEGGQYDLAVASNHFWGIMNQSSWLSGTPAIGSNNGVVRVTVQPNPSNLARTGSITLGNQTVGFRQEGRRTLTAGIFDGIVQMDSLFNSSSAVNHTAHYRFALSSSGAFSGRLQFGTHTQVLSGVLNSEGIGYSYFPATATQPAFTLILRLTQDGDRLEMLLTDGKINAQQELSDFSIESLGLADRQTWHSSLNPCNLPSRNHLLFTDSGPNAGNGFAIATVSPSGRVSVIGRLPDGVAFSQTTYASKDGRLSLFARPYKGSRGLLTGVLIYDAITKNWKLDTGLFGYYINTWIRPPGLRDGRLPEGVETTLQFQGSPYVAPVASELSLPVLHLAGNVQVQYDSFETEAATLTGDVRVFIPLQSGRRTQLRINPRTGLVTGGFFHPDTNRPAIMQGLVDSENGKVLGHYLFPFGVGAFRIDASSIGYKNPEDTPRRTSLGDSPLPVVSIKSPKVGATITNTGQVLVTGTASSRLGISQVLCQVFRPGLDDSPSLPVLAAGGSSWIHTIPLAPGDGGRYAVHTMALDSQGNQSRIAVTEFVVGLQGSLTVQISGPGTVTSGFHGASVREVGKLVSILARPLPGKRFTGWVGDHQSLSPYTTFLMKPNMSITATFAD